jgi:hypothetical protein
MIQSKAGRFHEMQTCAGLYEKVAKGHAEVGDENKG